MWTFLKAFLRNRKAAFGVAIVLFYALVALAAPIITSHDPSKRVARPHEPPSIEHVMGSTRMGRDVYTQLVWGTRTSLLIGLLAGLMVTASNSDRHQPGYFGADRLSPDFLTTVLVIPRFRCSSASPPSSARQSARYRVISADVMWRGRSRQRPRPFARQREFIQASALIRAVLADGWSS